MTLIQSDVSELPDAIRAGGDLDVIRNGVELVLQALIEAEAAEAIGAQGYERSEGRTTWRNGSRERLPSTKAGDVDLRIPKLRSGTFFPSILGRVGASTGPCSPSSSRPTCTRGVDPEGRRPGGRLGRRLGHLRR